ncbi:MAG: hypothetical protein Q9227_008057 [Pyrenula ochraceoflavens]
MASKIAIITLATLAAIASASPINSPRQTNPCFVIGSETLPQEVIDSDNAIVSRITCDAATTTIDNVPDVTSGNTTFSSINFANSADTPLTFALNNFATAEPLASNDIANFSAAQDVYLATEAGLRSVGGSLAIKVPKFFLSFQIARIKTAQGVTIADAGQTVEHLQGKVTKNAAGEDQTLIDQVNALATQLS